MESRKIDRFLECGSGYGYGYGYGSGSGSGDGSGSGSGYGSGFGSGYGYGAGYGCGSSYDYGDGSGYGIVRFCGSPVHNVDSIPTIFTAIHGNLAKGFILQSDLTLMPCFVAKVDGCFAHGETAREAMMAAREKAFEAMPESARIAAFLAEIEPGVKYPNRLLYDWHHRLTGSCEAGRKAFARDHGLTLDGEMTREEFFELTKDAYGGETIRRAMEAAKNE